MNTEKIDLFVPGMNDSRGYRIPAMIETKNGVIIAANDARIVSQRDNPNKINNVVRRSHDGGKTWAEIQTTVSFEGEGLAGPSAIDSSIMQDKETNTVWIMYCHSPGGIGCRNSEMGSGFDEQGRRVLINGQRQVHYIGEDYHVYLRNSDEKTAYTTDNKGFVYLKEKQVGNIYQKFDELDSDNLFEIPTCFLQIIKSEDDGETWSEPVELNIQVKEEWMRFIGPGPGVGIQLENSAYKGRLIFPIYYTNAANYFSCAVVFSDDNGLTWSLSESPNDSRKMVAEDFSAEDLGRASTKYELTESQAIELSNGDVVLYMRNHFGNGKVAKTVSKDGGKSWEPLVFEEQLINPICQFSVIKYNEDSQLDRLIFLGPNSETQRINGTIRMSEDGGKTWPYEKLIAEGPFMYSSMAQLADGSIGIIYECEDDATGYVKSSYTSVTIDDIKEVVS